MLTAERDLRGLVVYLEEYPSEMFMSKTLAVLENYIKKYPISGFTEDIKAITFKILNFDGDRRSVIGDMVKALEPKESVNK